MTTPPSIPDHTLLRPIGRGAYGEVWLARNIMGALRAVKVIERKQFDSERPYEREFAGVQSYEPVSRSADGLVHVLHVGRNDAAGYFYYVMELADATGEVLSASVLSQSVETDDRQRAVSPSTAALSTDYSPRTLRSDLQHHRLLPTADCLRLALDVVSGLARLHQQGLVHRDVKPGNIIFVEGRAKLADLGLVSADGEGRTFVGTEGYIAPEGPGTPAADLYAFGLSLYEASTGLRPEKFPDVPPEWMTEANSGDSLELHEVILKACEGQRERRYQNAEEMRADLALLRSGQSLRRVRALERRVKLARRSGLVATGVTLLAVAGVIFSGWRTRLAEQASARESALRIRAEAAEHVSRERLHDAYLAEARLAVQSTAAGRRFHTLETMRRAGAIRTTPEVRQAVFSALSLPDLRIEQRIPLDQDVSGHAFNADFTRYALARGKGPVEVYSSVGSNLLFSLPPATNLNARMLLFSPDDRYLAFKRDHGSGADAALEVWDLAATQRVFFAPHSVAYTAAAFHPFEPRLLMARPDGKLLVWELVQNQAVAEWSRSPARSLSYAPDGGQFVLAQPEHVVVRDATNGGVLARVALSNYVNQVAWHPKGHLIAACTDDGAVVLINATNGVARVIGRHKAQAVGVTFVPSGDFLITRGWDGEIHVWQIQNERCEVTLSLRASEIQVDRTGRKVAVLDNRGYLTRLEFNPGEECRRFATELAGVPRMARFSPDQRWLAIMTTEALTVWDLQRPGPPARADKREAFPLGFSSDSSELFAWLGDHLIRCRVQPGVIDGPPQLDPLPVVRRGQEFAPGSSVGTPAIWRRSSGGLQTVDVTNFTTGTSGTLSGTDWEGAVSPDGRWLARRSGSGVLTVLPLKEAGPSLQITNSGRIRFQVFSPDSASLAVLSEKELRILDTRTWAVRLSRPAEAVAVSHLAYSPDGRLLACAQSTRSGAVLDARTLDLLISLPDGMHPLEFSPDGRWLLIITGGRQVQLWDFAAVRAKFRELGIDWQD